MSGTPNPFLTDTCDGAPAAAAPCVQLDARRVLLNGVESIAGVNPMAAGPAKGTGRLMLLTAPRAGFGKTHLLEQIDEADPSRWFTIPLRFNFERLVSWDAALDQALHVCHSRVGSAAGVTFMSGLCRRLFAVLNCDLIRRGLVHCEEPVGATLDTLENRTMEMYDLANPSNAVGQWLMRNFEALLPAFAGSVQRWTGISKDIAAEWLRVLCAYEQGHADTASARWQAMQWGIRQISQATRGGFTDGVQVVSITGESEQLSAKQRLGEFLRLAGIVRMPIITVDGIDVLHRDHASCLRLSDLLTQLAARVPRSVLILSVNDDIWNAAFRNHLPSAIIDRLTGYSIRLGGLGMVEAEALVRERLESFQIPERKADRFMALSGIREVAAAGRQSLSPRAVLRHCARYWDTFESGADAEASREGEHGEADLAAGLFPEGEPQLAPAPNLASKPAHAQSGLAPLNPDALPVDPESAGVAIPDDPVRSAFDARMREIEDTRHADPVRIASLLRIAGQQFPMVRYREESIPSVNGAPPALAGVWNTGDAEVLFGLLPYQEQGYWKALARHAATRSSEASKLTLFDTSERPNVSAFLPADAGAHIDVIELNSGAIRRLAAASDLLDDAETGALAVPVPRALAGLVEELEFFWQRVTRPMK